jgi:hypothetical protein
MKIKTHRPLLTAAGLLLISASGYAQMTGQSHPELLPDDISTAPTPAVRPVSPPAPVVRPAQQYDNPVQYGNSAPSTAYAPPATSQAMASSRGLIVRPEASSDVVTDDVNSGIVTQVILGPNELPAGTSMRGNLSASLSTEQTRAGAPFSAVLEANVARNGVVLIPAGSTVTGIVTHVRGGRAIGGPAAIRLQPKAITLPDGTTYGIEAEVTDLDHFQGSHVNSEGTIVGNTNAKATAVALGLTTTSAVVAGAMIGGGVGAVVGLGVGAGVGTIWWFKQDRQQTLPEGTEIVFTLNNNLLISPVAH